MGNAIATTLVDIAPAKPTKQMVAAMKRANPVGEQRTTSDKPGYAFIPGRYTDRPTISRNCFDDSFPGVGGHSIQHTQNLLFALNDDPAYRLTDTQIAATWRALLPERIAYNAGHITGARNDYNNGTHGNTHKPETPCRQYRTGGPDDDGYLAPPKSKTVGVIA